MTWDITHSIWLREAVVTLSQADFDALDDETANQLTLIYAKAERQLNYDDDFYVGDASYRMVLDPRQYTNRLMIQYRDDPCRDECNTDESCQNYSAPPDSCTAEEEEEVVEEEVVEEEVVEEEEESEPLTFSTAPATSDIVLIAGTTGVSMGMLAYLLLKA